MTRSSTGIENFIPNGTSLRGANLIGILFQFIICLIGQGPSTMTVNLTRNPHHNFEVNR